MEHYTYREGTLEDTERLQKLGLNAYGQYKKVLSDENWGKLKTYLTGENTYPELLAKSKCFVCEDGGEVIGMAFFIPNGNPTDIFEKEWAYLRMIGVHTGYAGKGIGKSLTEMCIAYAREIHEKQIALHTSEFMDAARHIYEHIGFKQVRELPPRPGKRYWLYLLDL